MKIFFLFLYLFIINCKKVVPTIKFFFPYLNSDIIKNIDPTNTTNIINGSFLISNIDRNTNEFGVEANFTIQMLKAPTQPVKLCLKSSDTLSGGTISILNKDTECSNETFIEFNNSNWQEIKKIFVKGSRGTVGVTGNTNYQISFKIITNDLSYKNINLNTVNIINADIDLSSEYFVLIQPNGLTSGSLTITLNSNTNLIIESNSLTSFINPLSASSTYSVSINTQPTGFNCAFISNPFGVLNSHTTISIQCIQGNLLNGGIYTTSVLPTLSQSFAGMITISGSMPPTAISSDVDGNSSNSRFDNPIAITSDGIFIYVADLLNNKIKKVRISNGEASTLASINFPHGVATDGINVYASTYTDHKIKKIIISTGVVSDFAGSGVAGDSDGAALSAEFNQPTYLTLDQTNVYVSDRLNSKIKKINISTGIVSTMISGLNLPNGIAVDSGFLYIADSGNHQILRVDISNNTSTIIAGSGSIGGTNNTNGLLATFNLPYGITIDGSYIYVLEGGSKRFRRILKNSPNSVSTIMSQNDGYQDGVISNAKFCGNITDCNTSITTDGLFIYFADRYNHSIRKFNY